MLLLQLNLEEEVEQNAFPSGVLISLDLFASNDCFMRLLACKDCEEGPSGKSNDNKQVKPV